MTTVVETPAIASPTGLTPDVVRSLRRDEKVQLAGWHETVAGDNNGRAWLPGAIRRLSIEQRLYLASDDDADALWRERERRRVERNLEYFIEGYGHVRHGGDDQPGPPIPFALWVEQRDVLVVFIENRRVVVLKARQLGLTWLALHEGFHLIAFDRGGADATVLGLSQDGGYAKRLLERAREINDLLPPFLRHREDRETQDSKTEFKLADRGRMVSLPGSPAAPRSWQADLAICDEWAFVRNAQAGPTMTALMPAARKIRAISSGNGGPDEPGNGQHFAQLYAGAVEGSRPDWTPVFLPTSTHPARDDAWRESERENYDTEEEFLAEHPETDDDALVGAGKDRFFSIAEINAAVKLGGELDAMLGTDDLPAPEQIHGAIDWGEGGTAAYIVWPLAGGGVYVPPFERDEEPGRGPEGGDLPSLPTSKAEPSEVCDAFHAAALELQEVSRDTGALEPLLGEERYDAAGAQVNRTFLARARSRYAHQYAYREVRSRKVPFGQFKSETASYLRRLFRRTRQGREIGVIAISPLNPILIRQMRGLESAPDGLWKKSGEDHGPDAIVAGVQRIARTHREMRGGDK